MRVHEEPAHIASLELSARLQNWFCPTVHVLHLFAYLIFVLLIIFAVSEAASAEPVRGTIIHNHVQLLSKHGYSVYV